MVVEGTENKKFLERIYSCGVMNSVVVMVDYGGFLL